MNIVSQSYAFLHKEILPNIPKRHRQLFSFGIQAFTLQDYTSLNANARQVVANRHTAESKVYRLVKNKAILKHFRRLVVSLRIVKPSDTLNVDISTFCGFQVLTFAKQTHLGRAIPVYFSILRYPITHPGSQTIFIMKTIATVIQILRFSPHLVFDRGFESPYIVPFLVKQQIPFTLRVKKGKHVNFMGKDVPLQHLPWDANDVEVTVYDLPLRIVVSNKKQGMEEPWYILTNDTESTREQVVSRYYFRFEIEEAFKDLKHVNKIKYLFPMKKLLTFAVLLWFGILAIWLAFLVKGMQAYLIKRIKQKRRKKLSLVRYFFEQIQLTKTLLFQEVYAM